MYRFIDPALAHGLTSRGYRRRQRRQERVVGWIGHGETLLEPLEPRFHLSGNSVDYSEPLVIVTSSVMSPPADAQANVGGELHELSEVPIRHSNPGAAAKFYLDFDGHFQARWGEFTPGLIPPYDVDADFTTFSDAELANIDAIWSIVAEDFAPFNVDVTTEEPPVFAPLVAIRAAIGGSFDDWFKETAGGVAEVDSWSLGTEGQMVVYAWPDDLAAGDPSSVGGAVSHEFGHTLGLLHQDTFVDDGFGNIMQVRNEGKGSWAPLMGEPFMPVTTWHIGPNEEADSQETVTDELAVILKEENVFGHRPDDHGNSSGAGTHLNLDGRTELHGSGIIGQYEDRDVFVFDAGVGTIDLLVSSPSFSPNLDPVLELYDLDGNQLAAVGDDQDISDLTAQITFDATSAGTYVAVVKSSGVYGLIGQFELHGTVADPQAGISGRTFHDLNANGIQDLSGIAEINLDIQLYPRGPAVLTGDDMFTEAIDFGFEFNYFGQSHEQFFVSNNGIVTFDQPIGFFPNDLNAFGQPIASVAPFWADADLSEIPPPPPSGPENPDIVFGVIPPPPPDDPENPPPPPDHTTVFQSGSVHFVEGFSPRGNKFVQVDWEGVPYFIDPEAEVDEAFANEKTNDFTLYIEDDPAGDVVAFVYRNMFWTTGDFSNGEFGFGGIGAIIGFDSGDGEHFVEVGRPNQSGELQAFAHTQRVFQLNTSEQLGVEPPLADWTIFLDENDNGRLDDGEQSTQTDEHGNYAFSNLVPGEFSVAEELQDGWYQSLPATSIHAPDFTLPAVETLSPGETVKRVDFGNVLLSAAPPINISGQKFEDLNANGGKDSSEPGLSGWTIYVDLNDDGILDDGEPSAVTDNGGFYIIRDVPIGTHVVREVGQEGWIQSLPEEDIYIVGVTINRDAEGLNFGNFQPGQIGGTVFIDGNGNSLLNAGEGGIADFTVYLDVDGEAGLSGGDQSTTTGPDGSYIFDASFVLVPGNYTVGVVNPNPEQFIPSSANQFNVTIDSGELVENNNFGFVSLGSISGIKFEDANNNGAQDIGEQGLSDWTIYIDANRNGLLDEGEPTSVTNSFGSYVFLGLFPDEYLVREVLQEGWSQSSPAAGFHVVSVVAGQGATGFQFGNFRLSSIEGTKWEDLNGDGVRDNGEGGLVNWRIFIDENTNGQFDESEPFALTDDDGHYRIDALVPGTYAVVEQGQPGFAASQTATGAQEVEVLSGQAIAGIDFGNFSFTSISGTKFEDLNGDGIRNENEPPLAGWTIFVDRDRDGNLDVDEDLNSNNDLDSSLDEAVDGVDYNNDGDMVDVVNEDVDADESLDTTESSATTDPNGSYQISGLRPGTYTVAEVAQVGGGQSLPGAPDFVHTVTLISGDQATGVDFGNFRFGDVHGLVFNDLNGNGVLDTTGGAPVGSIELAPLGPVILGRNNNASTDVINFGFTFELFGEDYNQFYINNNGSITFTLPLADATPEAFPLNIPIIAPFWADVDTLSQLSGQVRLARGTSIRGNSFVQIDWSQVGYFSSHVDKLNDFTVYIEDDPAGDVVALVYGNMQWTTGDLEGNNGFGGVGAQLGYDSGDGENFVSLGRPSTAQQIARFANTQRVFRIDPVGTPVPELGLADVTVYVDQNNNNVLDDGEPMAVTSDDNPTTGADESGTYWISDLVPGTLIVRQIVPDGLGQTRPAGDAGLELTVTSGSMTENANFGNIDLGSISGHKFEDVNGDGVQNDAETGLEGFTVFIDDNNNGQLDPYEHFTQTDPNGDYVLDGLSAGTYVVAEIVPVGWVQTVPASASYVVALGTSEDATEFDFGNFELGEIRGQKFEDLDGDGVRGDDEAGVPEIVVFLDDNGNGALDPGERSTMTDGAGDFGFSQLAPGPYVVAEVLPAGWAQSAPGPIGAEPGVHAITLQSGQSIAGLEFGNFRFVEISGTKWQDVDGDGVRDAGELGLAGWTIFDDSNNNNVLDPSEVFTVTDVDGHYTLVLHPGNHTVAELLQDGWYQSFPLAGVHPVDATGGHNLSLVGGDTVVGNNFGNFQLASIAGTTRGTIDPDGNGPQGTGDQGAPGFIVFLDQNNNGRLDDGEVFQIADENGRYLFENLLPGQHRVIQQDRPFWLPSGPLGSAPRTVVLDIGQNAAGIDFLSTPNGADLFGILDDSRLLSTIVPGDSARLRLTILNIGTIAVDDNIVVDLYLSADQILDAGDVHAGSVNSQRFRVRPGQLRRLTIPIEIGQDLPVGSYFVLADIDATNVVPELLDENNVAAGNLPHEFAWLFGNVDGRRNVRLTVQDTAGTPTTFRLSNGLGEVLGGSNFDEINLNSSNRSVFRMTTPRGLYTTIHGLTTNGSLNGALAPTVNLGGGTYHVTGTARRFDFHNVTAPSHLMVDQWNGRSTVRMSFDEVADLSVTSQTPISKFEAIDVSNSDGQRDKIETPYVKTLKIERNFSNDLNLTSTAARQSIVRATIGRWLEDLTVWAPSDIGRLDFGGLRNANIYNGVRQDFLDDRDPLDTRLLPDSADDFLQNEATIGRMNVRGVEGEPYAMVNSNVASWIFKKVVLGRVKTAEVQLHGFAAQQIKSYFRQRDEIFSPRSSNLRGPLVADMVDQYIVDLIAPGTRAP